MPNISMNKDAHKFAPVMLNGVEITTNHVLRWSDGKGLCEDLLLK